MDQVDYGFLFLERGDHGDGDMRVAQDVVGNRAESKARQTGAAMRARDDQVQVFLLADVGNQFMTG